MPCPPLALLQQVRLLPPAPLQGQERQAQLVGALAQVGSLQLLGSCRPCCCEALGVLCLLQRGRGRQQGQLQRHELRGGGRR